MEPIEINNLKQQLFTDLVNPMKWLNSKGMIANGPPLYVEDFGNTNYFLNKNKEKWRMIVPDCNVLSARVNQFGNDGISDISVQLPAKSKVIDQLKVAAELVYNLQHLPCTQRFQDFEEFWANCGKPTEIMTVEALCFSRRGRNKEYINIYDKDLNELTGQVAPAKNGRVTLSLSFSLSESEDNGHYGFRPYFEAGILIQSFGGEPLLIKRPWDLNTVSESFSVDFHDSFLIKSPVLTVVKMEGNRALLDCTTKPDFVKIMEQLHQKAGKRAWDCTVTVCGHNTIQQGDFCLFQMWCETNESSALEWFSHKIIKSKKRKHK